MLRLNPISISRGVFKKLIQIQPMLRLNFVMLYTQSVHVPHSTTTNVKVKCITKNVEESWDSKFKYNQC